MSVVAAIDCGTNSVRLLVAELDGGGVLHERIRTMRIVRLGEGVDRTGEFSTEALSRTFHALDEYAEIIASEGVVRTRFVATSASRDVSNRDEFVMGVRERLGVPPEVITGEEEAALSFVGAIRGLPSGLVRTPALIVDIGGGSTEFVLGSAVPAHSMSVDIGCVRFTERHLVSDPPSPDEVEAAIADIDAALSAVRHVVPLAEAKSMVGLAGSVTTVAAIALGLDRYLSSAIHGSVIPVEQVDSIASRLLGMARAERAGLAVMHPGRVDVIGAGALILSRVMQAGRFPQVVASETDILDGIVYRMAASDC